MTLRLVIQLDERSLRYPLPEGELTLGSSPECDLRVPHFTVSRRHAIVRVLDGAVEIEDLGSSNGTTIDGRRITRVERVRVGQRLGFGGADGVLEEVSERDLEAAIRLGGGGDPVDEGPLDGETPATSSLSVVKRFTLDHLPELLSVLTDGASAAVMAQRVGASLLATVPCSGVEIVRRDGSGEGVVFAGGTVEHGGRSFEVDLLGGAWTMPVALMPAKPLRRAMQPETMPPSRETPMLPFRAATHSMIDDSSPTSTPFSPLAVTTERFTVDSWPSAMPLRQLEYTVTSETVIAESSSANVPGTTMPLRIPEMVPLRTVVAYPLISMPSPSPSLGVHTRLEPVRPVQAVAQADQPFFAERDQAGHGEGAANRLVVLRQTVSGRMVIQLRGAEGAG
jgi:hypothetical protein